MQGSASNKKDFDAAVETLLKELEQYKQRRENPEGVQNLELTAESPQTLSAIWITQFILHLNEKQRESDTTASRQQLRVASYRGLGALHICILQCEGQRLLSRALNGGHDENT
nr:hypothetical protein CFP56_10552 [Quercus suber]